MSDMILQLKEIRKSFDGTDILKGISLDIKRAEFITLLGSSGCGKTTTLRIIAGLESPDGGSVLLEDKDITTLEPNKRNVNTVFQNYALFPHMNVEDNVGYGLKIRKVPKAEIAERVSEMLKLVQLEEYGKRMPDQLSGGQRQRIAIARAVVNEPKVLLLDEPLGALDLKLRRQMQQELKRLQKQLGITFIYITHDQEEAINMSDRIAVMNQGVLEQVGTPNEIYYHPKTSYVADFVGNANILRCGGETFAIRSENVLINGEEVCVHEAQVLEKSFSGGQLRIVFRLKDGQTLTAARYGIDADIQVGSRIKIGWLPENAVRVEEDGPQDSGLGSQNDGPQDGGLGSQDDGPQDGGLGSQNDRPQDGGLESQDDGLQDGGLDSQSDGPQDGGLDRHYNRSQNKKKKTKSQDLWAAERRE